MLSEFGQTPIIFALSSFAEHLSNIVIGVLKSTLGKQRTTTIETRNKYYAIKELLPRAILKLNFKMWNYQKTVILPNVGV